MTSNTFRTMCRCADVCLVDVSFWLFKNLFLCVLVLLLFAIVCVCGCLWGKIKIPVSIKKQKNTPKISETKWQKLVTHKIQDTILIVSLFSIFTAHLPW